MIYKNIEVVPYNPNWPNQFAKEAEEIKQVFSDEKIEVHHVGSTSVPGLLVKPKIDIILKCKSNQNLVKLLKEIGYEYKGEFNIPFKRYFSKNKSIKFNLHVYEQDNPEIELNLQFRDYLRNNEEVRDEYALLKLNLLSIN